MFSIKKELDAIDDKLQSDIDKLKREAKHNINLVTDNYIALNRKYKDSFRFEYRKELVEIVGVEFRWHDELNVCFLEYFCYMPSVCGSVKIMGQGLHLNEHEIDELLKGLHYTQ